MIGFGNFLAILINLDLNLLNWLTEIIGKNEWGSITITRLNFFFWIFYYLFFIILKKINIIITRKQTWENLNKVEKTEFKLLRKLEKNKKEILKILIVIIIIISIINLLIVILPKNKININFIDVGQGDSTLIMTSNNKKILVDGGGSIEEDGFDVGENTLLPYLLNKNISEIDYIMISHFDSDHYQGCSKVMEKLKVDNVIICKQEKNSKNYEEFKRIVKEKKIRVIVVKKRRYIENR